MENQEETVQNTEEVKTEVKADVNTAPKAKKKKAGKTDKKDSSLVTKESLCAVLALFSALAFLILCTKSALFGDVIGGTIFNFLIGLLGIFAYPVLLGVFYLCLFGLIGKRLVKNRRAMTFLILAIVCLGLIIHTAATYAWEMDGYIAKCFYVPSAKADASVTVCGWVGGIIVYLLSAATTKVGAIIILTLCMAFFGYLTYFAWKNGAKATTENAGAKAQTSANGGYAAPVEIPLMQPMQNVAQPQATITQPMPTQSATPAAISTEYPQVAPQPNTLTPPSPYGMGNVDVMQQPAFTLSDEKPAPTQGQATGGSQAFSPFGRIDALQNPTGDGMDTSYQNSREFLFGSTPMENYQRNLIFDPNANVNKRNSNPTQSFGNSYTDSYQNEVNAQPSMPAKVFTDRSEPYLSQPSSLPTATPPPVTPVAPIEPIVPTPIQSEPVSPLYTLEEPQEREMPQTSPREEYLSPRTEELPTTRETPVAESGYRGGLDLGLFSPSNPNVFGDSNEDRAFARETFGDRDSVFDRGAEERNSFETDRDSGRDGLNIFDEEEDDAFTLRSDFDEPRGVEETRSIIEEPRRMEETDRFTAVERTPMAEKPVVPPVTPVKSEPVAPVAQPTPPPPPKPRVIRPYIKPRLDDFDCRDVEPVLNPDEVEETKENILATLEDFKVTGATIASTTFGPTVTRYNVTIPRNVSPQKVVALDQPIAISLRSSGVNIYPNYEDGVVSIEVPNKERQFVQLGCMLSGDTFVNAKSSSIMFAMGKDAGNRKVYGDISKMIHMLVAGSSGSGKSVFLGSLIISLIYKYSPEELRLILIDPKKTEFVLYNNLPHLMINEIITEAPKAVQSLNWAIGEMNRRYGLFEKMSRAGTYVVNLDQYNAHVEKAERLPKIVIIIDELADLMLAAKKDIEDKIQNLTQKARAAGIHLVVATQRPSTDVITGVIKSNLPTRIAFAVATDVDSRVILDQSGAQKLLGKGDFLYTMQGINTPVRVQSAFISAEDSQRIVNFIKSNNEAYYDETATAYINNARNGGGGDSFGDGDDVEPVYIDALRYVILSNSASISLIQRKCSIGYNKAGKIVEWMEEMGYISSFEGAKARKVLITKEEFESKYGSL